MKKEIDLVNSPKEEPEISVIVPIFNTEQYLNKCLDSIVNQTFQNMEIILVNDGSTDGSLDICKSYQQKDDRIKILSKENGGLISARKTGLSVARGKIIGFVDSDDWIEPEMYKQLMDCMTETRCDMVSSGIIRDFEKSEKSLAIYDQYEEGFYDDLENMIYPTMLFDENVKDFGLYCTLVNKIYKKELLEKIYENINVDVFYGEDALACYPYCLLAQSIYIMHKAFYHYNIRNNSMCSTPDERLPHNSYLLYKGLSSAFKKSNCSLVLMSQLKKYMMSLERHNLLVLYHIDVVAFDEWRFSFPQEMFDKRFVIYGAGGCGQALYKKICDMNKQKNMVLWIDKNAEKKVEECAYPIQKPDALIKVDWEIILVAVKSENVAHQIMDEVTILYHIDRKKVIWRTIEHISVWDIY